MAKAVDNKYSKFNILKENIIYKKYTQLKNQHIEKTTFYKKGHFYKIIIIFFDRKNEHLIKGGNGGLLAAPQKRRFLRCLKIWPKLGLK